MQTGNFEHCIHFNINLLPRPQFRKDNVQVCWHGRIAPELLDLTLFPMGHPTRLPDMTSAWSNSSCGSVMPSSGFTQHAHTILRWKTSMLWSAACGGHSLQHGHSQFQIELTGLETEREEGDTRPRKENKLGLTLSGTKPILCQCMSTSSAMTEVLLAWLSPKISKCSGQCSLHQFGHLPQAFSYVQVLCRYLSSL